jgi:hypothetical protein
MKVNATINNMKTSKKRIIFFVFKGNSSYMREYSGGFNDFDIHPNKVGLNLSLQSYNTSYQANETYEDIPSKNPITMLCAMVVG